MLCGGLAHSGGSKLGISCSFSTALTHNVSFACVQLHYQAQSPQTIP